MGVNCSCAKGREQAYQYMRAASVGGSGMLALMLTHTAAAAAVLNQLAKKNLAAAIDAAVEAEATAQQSLVVAASSLKSSTLYCHHLAESHRLLQGGAEDLLANYQSAPGG